MDCGGVNLSPGLFFTDNSNQDNHQNSQNWSSVLISTLLNEENEEVLEQGRSVVNQNDVMAYFYEELQIQKPKLDFRKNSVAGKYIGVFLGYGNKTNSFFNLQLGPRVKNEIKRIIVGANSRNWQGEKRPEWEMRWCGFCQGCSP